MSTIAFVSSHPHPGKFRSEGSYIYRCENLALGLEAMGHQVQHRHLNSLLRGAVDFDVAVFQRPTDSLRFRWVAGRLKRAGCRMVADFDDLIFHPAFAAVRPSVLLGDASASRTARKFKRNQRALARFDGFLLSTDELARRFAECNPGRPMKVIPNASHRSWRALPRENVVPRRVTYFSGTRTHDRDFALVMPALKRLLQERDDFVLQIVGPLDIELAHPRVQRVEKVRFAQFADHVRSSYINLAPLEDTAFNRCKSALKAIEAGSFGVPTVASPIGDYLRVATEGILYARTDEEWYSQLRFALDEANHAKLSAGLAERMRPLSDVDRFAQDFLDFVAWG
jgi:glycosyltransferase involved in cell wall biosynthesis